MHLNYYKLTAAITVASVLSNIITYKLFISVEHNINFRMKERNK